MNVQQQEEQQRAYFRNQIEVDPTTTYGDGFREARMAEQSLGLNVLLEYLLSTGGNSFPQI